MGVTAATRKSLTDLTRRRARAAFTIVTLAIAVASIGIFSAPSLMQQAMDREIAATRLADLTVTFAPLEIDARRLAAIRSLPNVVAIQPKAVFSTRVLIGARRQRAVVIGVPGFDRQPVDAITRTAGELPAAGGGVLTELQNREKRRFEAPVGGAARSVDGAGRIRSLPITGEARYLGGGQLVADAATAAAVFYAPLPTVEALSGAPGTTMLAVRLRDATPAAAERTAADIREELARVPGFRAYADYPEIRARGAYPGQELFEQMTTIMTLVTVLALLSSLVLVSSTMTTLVGEQTGEIASMKAIGASRRDIARIYRRTALIFGGLAAVLGAVLGLVLANVLTNYFGRHFYGIDAGFHLMPAVVLASLLVGVCGPPLAAWPAIRRASRLPLSEALRASGSATGGQGALDRLVRRIDRLPRTAQIGVRGAIRRKRRAATTVLQIALAVATLLSVLTLGTGIARLTHAFFQDARWDIWVQTYASAPLDAAAEERLAAIDGVAEVQPLLTNVAKSGRTDVHLYGLAPRPMYRQPVVEGRWYTAQEQRSSAPVIVIGRALADRTGVRIGDQLPMRTSAGNGSLRVIGLTSNEVFQGTAAYLPISTLQHLLLIPGRVNNAWIRTGPRDHAAIDRISARVEDAMAASGHQVSSLERYVSERENVASNAGITKAVAALGLLIVLISLVGLVNTITMGVIERTREIGMLRCVGASARDIRRIFSVEGVAVASAGWLLGVPLGWAMSRGLLSVTASTADIDLPFTFPAGRILLTLVGTLLLALLVLQLPVRRAARLRPGDALRHT
jgi:putative ABC transport system permease protein